MVTGIKRSWYNEVKLRGLRRNIVLKVMKPENPLLSGPVLFLTG